MLDYILSGLNYGILGGVAVVVFIIACILMSPLIVFASSIISAIFRAGSGGENDG